MEYVRAFVQIGQSLAEGGIGEDAVAPCAPACAATLRFGPIGIEAQILSEPIQQLREKKRVTIASSFLADICEDSDHRLIFHGQAWGGMNASQLDKGGVSGCFEAIVRQAEMISSLSDEAIRYEAITCIHGEQDGIEGNTQYSKDLLGWYRRLASQLCKVTGQEKSPPLLISQTNSGSGYGFTAGVETLEFLTPLAQLETHIKEKDVHLVCPAYFLGYVDHSHLSNAGQHRLGHYFAKAFRAITEEGGWEPLRPSSISAIGPYLSVNLVGATAGISIDCELVEPIENFGFQLLDQGNARIKTVKTRKNSILLVLNKPLENGAVLAYAYNNGKHMKSVPARGNIRDNDPVQARDGCGPLHNWLVCFREPVVTRGWRRWMQLPAILKSMITGS